MFPHSHTIDAIARSELAPHVSLAIILARYSALGSVSEREAFVMALAAELLATKARARTVMMAD